MGDVLNGFYDAVQDQDLARTGDVLDPAVVWEVPAVVADLGRLQGRAAVLKWLSRPMPGANQLAHRSSHPLPQPVEGRQVWTTDDGTVELSVVRDVRAQDGVIVHLREHLPYGLLKAHIALSSVAPAPG